MSSAEKFTQQANVKMLEYLGEMHITIKEKYNEAINRYSSIEVIEGEIMGTHSSEEIDTKTHNFVKGRIDNFWWV